MLSTTLTFLYGSNPEEEIDRDITCCSRMEYARRVNKGASVIDGIVTSILLTATGTFAFILEPTDATKIAAGVLTLSAISVHPTCNIFNYTAEKIEENYLKSISTKPTKSMITLEQAIIQYQKKIDLVDSNSCLQKIWAQFCPGNQDNDLEAGKFTFQDTYDMRKWRKETRDNAEILVSGIDSTKLEEEIQKYDDKLRILEGYSLNKYIKAMREEEYRIIIEVLGASKKKLQDQQEEPQD